MEHNDINNEILKTAARNTDISNGALDLLFI